MVERPRSSSPVKGNDEVALLWTWMEKEVAARLRVVDEKLDRLSRFMILTGKDADGLGLGQARELELNESPSPLQQAQFAGADYAGEARSGSKLSRREPPAVVTTPPPVIVTHLLGKAQKKDSMAATLSEAPSARKASAASSGHDAGDARSGSKLSRREPPAAVTTPPPVIVTHLPGKAQKKDSVAATLSEAASARKASAASSGDGAGEEALVADEPEPKRVRVHPQSPLEGRPGLARDDEEDGLPAPAAAPPVQPRFPEGEEKNKAFELVGSEGHQTSSLLGPMGWLGGRHHGSVQSNSPLKAISESDYTPTAKYMEANWHKASERSSFSTRKSLAESWDSSSTIYRGGGLRGCCGLVGSELVVHPNAGWYKVWNYFTMIMVMFSTFFTPVRYGFVPGKDAGLLYLDSAIDCIFAVDMLLTCNVALKRKEGLITQRKRIFCSYVSSTRFRIDLLATVPFDMVWAMVMGQGYGGEDDIVFGILGLLRLLRVNRILELFRELQKSTQFNLLSVVVLKFVIFILLTTHTAGCIMYGIARANAFQRGTWVFEYDPTLPEQSFASQYMHALYWAVGTFKAGPAHASLSPRSAQEMLVACLAMMLNICMNVYLVSSMAALLTTADTRIYAHRKSLHQLGEFADRYSLPSQLQKQLQSYLWFKFNTDQDLEQTVLSSFPELYQSRINHTLYASFISGMRLFQGCAPAFLSQIYGCLKPSLHMAQHTLVNAGEPSRQLQIIASGEVDMYYEGDWFEIRLPGETITDVPFICNVDQQFMVRTRMLCRVLSIDRRAWLDACQLHAVDLGLVTANLLSLCRQRATESEIQSPGEAAYENLAHIVECHIVRLNESNVGSLCFAAQRGDLEEMKRFLAVTSAAGSDYDKRSPLHIAAANGQVEAITLLIEHKANINAVDNFGRTPLLEACRSKQHAAATALFAHKAELGFSSKLTLGGQTKIEELGDAESSVSTGDEVGQYDGASESIEAGELCQAASDPEQLWYLKALLKYGANPNAHDYDARTALHVACAAGNKFAVKLLLTRSDVNTDACDNFGRTALMEAVRHGHEACARLLHAKGAHHGFCVDTKENTDANAVQAGGELCQAAFSNQLGYLDCLISYCGLNVDVADYDKRTALMLACAEGNWDAAITLVQHRADVNNADRWGHTALSEAKAHGHPDLAKVLKDMSLQHGRTDTTL